MADARLGRQLIEAGWDQGVLLPALCWSVDFYPEDPVTQIARAAMKPGTPGTRWDASQEIRGLARHAVASGLYRGDHRLVVASQACDIDKSPEHEPCVIALRAFFTTNERMLEAAGRNSTRHFLLNPARGLVVDATVQALVEKPLLATLSPELGAPDARMRRRFARWLARRYNRPALPDDIVHAVSAPILTNLRALQQEGNALIDVLDQVEEVRLAHLEGTPPYAVRLLFILPEPDSGQVPDNDGAVITALARLISTMRGWFDPALASLQAWDAARLGDISASALFDTDELALDEFTYRGLTVRGLEPRQFG
jgi:hypothetical protein